MDSTDPQPDPASPPFIADPYGRLVDHLARPIRDEVSIRLDRGPEDVRFHRLLTELVQDCAASLTPLVAGRAAAALAGEVAQWLARQREADASRSAEMTELVQRMGLALKSARGDDARFFEDMDQGMARLREAADSRSLRSVSQQLASVIDEMTARLQAQQDASEARVKELTGIVEGLNEELRTVKSQASEDPLTGLLNRGAFDQRLSEALDRAKDPDYRFCLVLIDLDHFKSVNDTHGHVAGDRVLRIAAEVVSRHVIRRSDVAARYGGEEFALILDDTDAAAGARLAEEIRASLEQKFIPVRGEAIIQTASFGVAQGTGTDTANSLIHRADRCLYAAKKSGRNRVVTADSVIEGRAISGPRGMPPKAEDEVTKADSANDSGSRWFTALRTRRSGRR